jgi:DivIVA domain-containing protein
MELKLTLTSEQILNKKFNGDVKGYASDEVDSFLDQVLEQFQLIERFTMEIYPLYQKALGVSEAQKKRIEELEIEMVTIRDRLSELREIIAKKFPEDRLELVKRVSQLEKALYKVGVDPNKI